MPLYTFQCQTCHHQDEYLMKIAEKAPSCSSCGADNQKKLVTSFYGHTKEGYTATKPAAQVTPKVEAKKKHSCPGSRASSLIEKYEKQHRPPSIREG